MPDRDSDSEIGSAESTDIEEKATLIAQNVINAAKYQYSNTDSISNR